MSVPTRRFGRTGLRMPVLTCGGMRYQQNFEDPPPAEIEARNQDGNGLSVLICLPTG